MDIYLLNMRKVYILLAAAALSFSACNKTQSDDNGGGGGSITNLADIDFTIEYENSFDFKDVPTNITIPPGGITFPFPPYEEQTNSKQYLEQYNISESKLKTVKMEEFEAIIQQPANQTFDFMEWIEIYVSAPGLDEQLAVEKKPIPKGIKSFKFDSKNVELKDYFLKETMSYRIVAHFNAAPDSTTVILLKPKIRVIANPLK